MDRRTPRTHPTNPFPSFWGPIQLILEGSSGRSTLVLLAFPQGVAVLLQGTPQQLGLLPEVGRQEAVGVGHGHEGGLEGVLEGLGRAGGRGVGILDTRELEEALDGGRGDEASTAGSGDQLQRFTSVQKYLDKRGFRMAAG